MRGLILTYRYDLTAPLIVIRKKAGYRRDKCENGGEKIARMSKNDGHRFIIGSLWRAKLQAKDL